MKIVDTARCRWQIHMAAQQTGYENIAPRSCGLSSAEMIASGGRCEIGWIGERQDWPITAPFLDRWSRRGRLGREMLAIAWLTALREETEKARGVHML
jgi:hypothetical protein